MLLVSAQPKFTILLTVRFENLRKDLERGANAISKRTFNSVLNGGSAFPSNTVRASDLDCTSHIKNGRSHQFDSSGILRT